MSTDPPAPPFPVSDHCDGRTFFPAPGQLAAPGFLSLPKWWWQRMTQGRGTPWPAATTASGPASATPVLPAAVPASQVAATFIGHSTFLLQTAGLNLLTDPVLSDRASPFTWAGPRRLVPPALTLAQLPRIDVVVLSHNHYDHLDLASLRWLARERQPQIVTTLGNKAWLEKRGVGRVAELDWWQARRVSRELEVVVTPAQHFSARTPWDRCRTLWGGFALNLPAGRVYFAGDSGYCETFREIGARLGPFDLALLPIGAYEPRWFMRPVHCTPAEAVKVHRDVRARASLAMHFGCFPLADDAPGQAEADFLAARAAAGLTAAEFALPLVGGTTWHRLAG